MVTGRIQVTFDAACPVRLAQFWADVLGYPSPDLDHWRAESDLGPDAPMESIIWCRIEDPTGAGSRLAFQQVPEPKAVKNRLHLDVAVPGGEGTDRRPVVDADVERVVNLGARRLRAIQDDGPYYVVLQDPEGNEFCLD